MRREFLAERDQDADSWRRACLAAERRAAELAAWARKRGHSEECDRYTDGLSRCTCGLHAALGLAAGEGETA